MARPRKCDCGKCTRCKHREYMQAWYWANRDKVCETARATRGRHVEKIREDDRRRGCRSTEPAKRSARRKVNRAVANGTLERQPCQVCGNPKVDAHHEDYSRPLAVEWLCRRHHGERHRKPLPEQAIA